MSVSYAFSQDGYASRLRRWFWSLLGYPPSPSATTVTLQTYVAFDDVGAHSTKECQRADRHNERVHRDRLAAFDVATAAGLEVLPVRAPPAPTNESRRATWVARNAPMRADDQARAVEALVRAGFRVARNLAPPGPTEYEAHRAEAERTARNVAVHCNDSNPSMNGQQQAGRYTTLTDDQIATMTHAECRRIDRRNERSFQRSSRTSRKIRSRVSSLTSGAVMVDLRPAVTHVHRKEELENRGILVSAQEQAEAVEALWAAGYRLYVHYQPQNAIGDAAKLAPTTPPAGGLGPAAAAVAPPEHPEPDPEPECKRIAPMLTTPATPSAPPPPFSFKPASHTTTAVEV